MIRSDLVYYAFQLILCVSISYRKDARREIKTEWLLISARLMLFDCRTTSFIRRRNGEHSDAKQVILRYDACSCMSHLIAENASSIDLSSSHYRQRSLCKIFGGKLWVELWAHESSLDDCYQDSITTCRAFMNLSFLEQKHTVEDVFRCIAKPEWMVSGDLHIFHSQQDYETAYHFSTWVLLSATGAVNYNRVN